jgi:dTDP-4-amino-4,6-dideoxygalactose transaminase
VGGTGDGSKVAEWEAAVASFVGVPHATVMNSGRRGMALIMQHLGIGVDDEVIVPAYTLKDLIPLIQRFGAKVVPADIEPGTFSISPETVQARITPKTKAILALHAFGAPCAILRINEIAQKAGIAVIEDCAHSFGATIDGQQTGSFGDAAFFSFETTKPINTFGGGMVVSKDAALIESIQKETANDTLDFEPVLNRMKRTQLEQTLFRFGLTFPFLALLTSPTFKESMTKLYRKMQPAPPSNIQYSDLQAELGLRRFATWEDRQIKRRATIDLLQSLLAPEIQLQRVAEGCTSTWCWAIAVLPCDAAPVRQQLLWRGIDAGVEDEIVDDIGALLGYTDCPQSEEAFRRTIMLPLYEDQDDQTVRKVAGALNAIVAKATKA